MKAHSSFLALALGAGIFASCTLLGSKKVQVSDLGSLSPQVHFLLEQVEVDAGASSEKISQNAHHIASLLLSRRNRTVPEPKNTLRLHLRLGEEVFLRGFTPLTSVYGELSLYEGDGTNSLISLYSRETREGLSSYPFLYSFLQKTLEKLP